MKTENTEVKVNGKQVGWICFDAGCGVCTGGATRWQKWFSELGYRMIPIQTEWVMNRIGNPKHLTEPALITCTDKVYRGSDIIFEIARRLWWGLPWYWLSFIPGIRPLCRGFYRFLARHRYGVSRVCGFKGEKGIDQNGLPTRWLMILACSILAITPIVLNGKLAWILMWGYAFALWLGLKLIVFEVEAAEKQGLRHLLLWLIWPGTNAREFFVGARRPKALGRGAVSGIGNLVLGASLTWLVTSELFKADPYLAIWTGMIGIVLLLHFGMFRLLSTGLQAGGVNARPIMDFPIGAGTLAEFWGRRWNRGFSDPARRYVFFPVARRSGTAVATMAVFLVSGILHDLILSVPAGGGYGLPTIYFLIQGSLVLPERQIASPAWRGILTICGTTFPVLLLFHFPFIENVMLPFLKAVGATGKVMP